jgi:WD40 repeat protein
MFSAESLASASDDRTVRIWTLSSTGTCQSTQIVTVDSGVSSVAFSPDGSKIAAGSHDRKLSVFDLRSGDCEATLTGDKQVNSVAFSPDGKILAAGDSEFMKASDIRLYDVRTGEIKSTLTGHSDSVSSVAFSADGQWVMSGSDDKTIRLWDIHAAAALSPIIGV